MQLAEHIGIAPFVRILPLLAAGILTAGYVSAPTWVTCFVTVAIYLLTWLLRNSQAAGWYIAGTIFVTGILLGTIRRPVFDIPHGEKIVMAIEIRENPALRGRWQQTTAQIGWYKSFSGIPTKWDKTSEKIQCYIDTAAPVSAGEQLIVSGYLNPVDTTGSRYGTLMHSRGITARCYLNSENIIVRTTEPIRNANYYAALVQQAAVTRLSQLRLDETDRNMVTALIAGEKRGISPQTKNAYSRTGVAHILAISGLHMGFVLIIANLFFGWLVLFRKGHILKNTIVILALWIYAVTAGLSPSVVRAAIMMSAAQIALGASVRTDGYNIVFGAATLMLAVNPYYLFDISFQLSFIAVLAILFIYPRLYRRRLGRTKITDFLWSTLLLSLAAQIGVAPLIAYNFGNLPLISLLVNPPVIFCSFAVVCTGLLWLIIPVSVLNPVCSPIISRALNIQNTIVDWAASRPGAAVDQLQIPGWQATAAYILMIGICLFIKLREDARERNPEQRLRIRKKSRIFAHDT